MSPRRGVKSRNGCINCKRRKVKCDEIHPACSNCIRREVSCTYSVPSSHGFRGHLHPPSRSGISPPKDTSSNLSPHNSLTDHSRISPPPIFDQVCPVSPSELANRNLELMHHFCIVTADTLSIRKDVLHVWKNAFPRQGYRHPFVMHGILAVSAAHKAFLFPSDQKTYLDLADYYQTIGSIAFRPRLENVNEQNWMPLFSFATVLAMYMLTRPLRGGMGAPEDPIDNLLDLTGLLRGINTTLTPLRYTILNSEFAPLSYGTWSSAETMPEPAILPPLGNTLFPDDTWAAISKLRAFVRTRAPYDKTTYYQEAIDGLEDCAKMIALAGINVETSTVLSWVFKIDKIIVSDLRERIPHALVLIAYYSVFLATLEKNYWYSVGWAGQLLGVIERGMTAEFEGEDVIQWPRRCFDHITNRINMTK